MVSEIAEPPRTLLWHADRVRTSSVLHAITASWVMLGCPASPTDTGDSGADSAPTSADSSADSGPTGADTNGDGDSDSSDCFMAPLCNPLGAGCSGTDKCIPNDGVFACAPMMDGIEEFAEGEPCDSALSCQSGLVCRAAEDVPGCSPERGEGCCVAVCDLSAPTCSAGTTCTSAFETAAPMCFEDVGVCLAAR